MNCAQLRPKISPYLDTELSFTELTHFKEHLAGCTNCTALVTRMANIKVALLEGIQATLSEDFVPRLKSRLRAEIDRPPSLWSRVTTPRVLGLSPASLSGLAAAGLALAIIGAGIFKEESAPIIDPPRPTTQSLTPALIGPAAPASVPSATPLFTASPGDSAVPRRDSSQRDFSRQIKLVNTQQRP